jgi:hypothetical protein
VTFMNKLFEFRDSLAYRRDGAPSPHPTLTAPLAAASTAERTPLAVVNASSSH